jgi:hypothetical protein
MCRWRRHSYRGRYQNTVNLEEHDMTTPDNQQPVTDEPLALGTETLDDLDPQNDATDIKGGNRPSQYGPAC